VDQFNCNKNFNCSEDYFEEDLSDTPEGDPYNATMFLTYKCKLCGWSFKYNKFSEHVEEWIINKMRDHVHLRH